MNNSDIDRLICRARRAWVRRPEYNGHDPIIADSDIIVRDDVEIVELRDGDCVLAQFALRGNGELRFLRDGRY